MSDAMFPPEAREAVARAIHAKRYTRLGCDVEPMDNSDARYCGSLADAALAALAPFVAQIKAAAFQRGAEAMRKALLARLDTIQHVTPETWQAGVEAARVAARTQPIPEDKQP